MNLRLLDLNLLLVFDAVSKERSITRAAARMNLTQPALSQALGRLRSVLGDELFLRTPGGMEPTPFCLSISAPIRTALEDIQNALRVAAPFDPEHSKQDFTIALDNRSALMLGASMALALSQQARGLTLNLLPSGMRDVFDLLDDNDIELAVGSYTPKADRFSEQHLFDDTFKVLLRDEHPAVLNGRTLALADLAHYPQLELTSTRDDTSFVDEELAKHALERKIALRAPLLSAVSALTRTDMMAIISERGGRALAEQTRLQVAPLPFKASSVRTNMVWHRRHQDVPAHIWLRDAVLRHVKAGSVDV